MKPVVPTFTELDANTYFPSKYGNPDPVDLQALAWFPYLPIHDHNIFSSTIQSWPSSPKGHKRYP